MSYIWENYDKKNYYYIPKNNVSNYQEVWSYNDSKLVPVNIYNRFMDVFYPKEFVINKDLNQKEIRQRLRQIEQRYKNDEKIKDIVNIIIHQLAMWDRFVGVTLEDIEMSLLYDDIKNGLYGKRLMDEIDSLKKEDLYFILKELVKSNSLKNKKTLFDEVLYLLFGKVIFYKKNMDNKIIVYIEQFRNEYREKVFNIAKYLFADMQLEIEVFWANEHFGIIGNESTMHIDRINIY